MSTRGAHEGDARDLWDGPFKHGAPLYDAYVIHRLQQPLGRAHGEMAHRVWNHICAQEMWIAQGLGPPGTRRTRLSPDQLEQFGAATGLRVETSPATRRLYPELGEEALQALLPELTARLPADTFFQVFARIVIW